MKVKKNGDHSTDPVMNDNDDYQVKNHLNTLVEAHEIASDPNKMKRVKKLAGRHKKAIRSIQDLRDASREFSKEPDGDGEI